MAKSVGSFEVNYNLRRTKSSIKISAAVNVEVISLKNCYDWAGGLAGENFACQGNILVTEATVKNLQQMEPAAGSGTSTFFAY